MKNERVEKIFYECMKIVDDKNHDYASEEDFYKNFRMVEVIGTPAWIGCYIRFLDKVSRMNGFIERLQRDGTAEVKNESIEDTFQDAINYMAICLDLFRQQAKDKKRKPKIERGNND